MKKILSALLTLTMMMTLFTGMAFADPGNGNGKFKGKDFKDIKGHWGMETIMKMQALGILKGYDDDTFRPENTLTQAELAVIIDRLVEQKIKSMGIEDKYVNDDDDDDDDEDLDNVPAWAKKSVKKGFEKGYLDAKRFHSEVQVSRLQTCVELAKALEREGFLDVNSTYDSNPFKDKGLFENADDYRYILALYEAGYIKGNPDGNFNPNAFLNRAHMASIIENLLDDDEDSNDKEKPEWDNDSFVTASAVSADSVVLKWSAADDNEGVAGYKVMYELNGDDKVKLVVDGRSVKITGLDPDEEYEFTVEARDAAGNWSEDGPSVKVTTLEENEVDTIKPYWPSGSAINDTKITTDSIALEWDAAKDNVAVKGYEVKVYSNGSLVDPFDPIDSADNDIVIENLDDDTEYTFQVRAYDEAGNKSIKLTAVYTTLSK